MVMALLKLISPEGWAGIVVSLALGTLLAVQTVKTHYWHAQSDRFEWQYQHEFEAAATNRAAWRQAAVAAERADAANKARVEAEQTTINQQRGSSYEERIAAARARAGSVPHSPSGDHQGSSGTAPVRAVPAAPGSPAQAPGEDGLSDALIATEQAIQLDELIKWVRQQHAVEVNGRQQAAPGHP
jgi:hypothetical protein